MKILLQLIFLVPAMAATSYAAAGPVAEMYDPLHFCTPRDLAAEPIVTCEDNSVLAQAADDCIEKYEAHFALRRSELEKGLLSNLNQRIEAKTVSQQQGNFTNSGQDYAQTKATLKQLSELGRQTQEEISGYRTYLKLAFHWPQDEPLPDLEDPELEEYLNTDECYGESNAMIRAVQARLAQMLADIDRAQAGSGNLSELTLAKAGAIGARAGDSVLAGTAGGKLQPVRQGKSASDITGLREELAKQKTPATGKIFASAVTGVEESNAPAPSGSLPSSGAFAAMGSLVAPGSIRRAPAGSSSPKGSVGAKEDSSLGAMVWSKPEKSQDGDLEVKLPAEIAEAEKGQAAHQKENFPEGSVLSVQSENTLASREPAVVAASPQTLASAEQSIFRSISLRYRSTELFRAAGLR